MLGGQSPDMFPASNLDIFPGKVSAGMFEPMDDYIDFNSDSWCEGCKSINDMNSIGGKHYLSCVYTNTGFVMIYNKKTIEANGLEDPAKLAYNNEWTWSKFKDMCYEFADRKQDKYAVGGWWYEPAMMLSTGNPLIKTKNDLEVEVNELKILKANFDRQKYIMQDNVMKKLPLDIQNTQNTIKHLKEDIQFVSEQKPLINEEGKEYYPVTINGKEYSDKEMVGKYIVALAQSAMEKEKALVSIKALNFLYYMIVFSRKIWLALRVQTMARSITVSSIWTRM